MVVISIVWGRIFAANIDDGVSGFELLGIACSKEGTRIVGWEKAKHVDCKSFVGVEVAVVSGYQRPIGVHSHSLRKGSSRHTGEGAKHATVGVTQAPRSWNTIGRKADTER